MFNQRKPYGEAPQGGAGFNKFAAGRKVYGMGRTMPNIGKVSDMSGYNERDAKAKARREALIRRAGGK